MPNFNADDRPEKRTNVYLTESQVEAITEHIYERVVHRLESEFGKIAIRAILLSLGAGGVVVLLGKGILEIARK